MNFKKTIFLILSAVFAISVLLCGCSASGSNESAAEGTSSGSFKYEDMFTERDLDDSYDEGNAVKIVLKDNETQCDSSAVAINDNTITISCSGTYILSGNLTDGQIAVDASDTDKIQLVLNGVDITCKTSAALYIKQADKVFITLAEGTSNSLANTDAFSAVDDNNIDAVIFSKEDITLNGKGNLNINSAYGHGIVSKDDLVLTGGVYNITAESHALSGKNSIRIADGSFNLTANTDGLHAENADDASLGFIYIYDGDFEINSESDAMDAAYDLQIDGGTFNISCADDGIHSECGTFINSGEIRITKSYEGIEGETVTINGGKIYITSSDDGINAAGSGTDSTAEPQDLNNSPPDMNGSADMPEMNNSKEIPEFDKKDNMPDMNNNSDNASEFEEAEQKSPDLNNSFDADENCFIKINGGYICIDAEGDGIDSNGNLYVNGGETYVYGPVNDGNGALDYAGSAQITGGIIVAAGPSGMAQNFGSDSTQCSMLVNTSERTTDKITLKDSSGNEIISVSPSKEYNSVLISCPGIQQGQTYSLETGDTETTVEMTEIIYSSNTNSGGDFRGKDGGMGITPPDNENNTPPSGNSSNSAPPDEPEGFRRSDSSSVQNNADT